MDHILKDKKCILVCGSGGVGKTTLSASLALRSALLGQKTVVLTIDPAKRLASSLGLNALKSEPQKISKSLLKKVGGDDSTFMEAMMLDPKSTFDKLVSKYAPNKESEKKILDNKIYQHVSSMISGSQEYMAMEKLYEIVSLNKYDTIIIDTPPTIHALDFLEAPNRMISALSDSMIHLLLKPAMKLGGGGLKFFQRGSKMILKIFDRITGFAFLQDISEMLIAFQDLLEGFQSRADEVGLILKDKSTAFILVSACEDKSIQEAFYFSKVMKEKDFNFEGFILNRVHPYYKKKSQDLEDDKEILYQEWGARLADKALKVFEDYQKVAKKDTSHKKELSQIREEGQFLTTIPLFESDIHSLKGLKQLSSYIKN